MTAATRQMPIMRKITQPHNDEHSALSLKGYVRSSLGQYVRSSLHCIKIGRAMDPCAGSGHICAYLFDVLVQIYQDYGYNARESVRSIIENNIYGLDIDERATQLAYFSIMMKAVQYDPRFLRRSDIPQPHVYTIVGSNGIDQNTVDYYVSSSPKIKNDFEILIHELYDAKAYGAILNISNIDFNALYTRANQIIGDISIYGEITSNTILPLIREAEVLSKQYDVVVTNPPYMNRAYMPNKLKKYVDEKYPDFKSDMFAVFTDVALRICKKNGHIGLLSPYVWMFISAYEKMRLQIYDRANITTLVQLEYNAFEAACVPVAAYTLCKTDVRYSGEYIRLSDFKGIDIQAPKTKAAVKNSECGYRYTVQQTIFSKIAGSPVAYWISNNAFRAFDSGISIDSISDFTGSQHKTADNEKYLRFFWEVAKTNIDNKQWIFYIKGGEYRKWYGNINLVVDWSTDARNYYVSNPTSNMIKEKYWMKEGITYTSFSSAVNGFRYLPPIGVFDIKGPSMIAVEHLYYCLAFFNSSVANMYMKLLNPTATLQVKDVKNTPLLIQNDKLEIVESLSKENVDISRQDWDSFETSYDFICHPLIGSEATLLKMFENWAKECNTRFSRLKSNEEELNRIFIEIYGLHDELIPEVEDKDVSVRLADKRRDVRSFISYAVGCMLGRYSLDVNGLAYAGGEWDASKYTTFIPDKDAIIPICDDEYFTDDIVNRFVDFVRVVYGEETLEENLKFIADALGGSGTARQVIRNYFINDFYNDHCKIYQKRPIYWLFDSGKKNGFKCLIYMHRYQSDTIARIRTDYMHEQQSRYRTAIADLEGRILSAATSERVRLNKQLSKLQAQSEELRVYEEKIHHLADQYISIDLDNGVKANYAKLQDVLAKIK